MTYGELGYVVVFSCVTCEKGGCGFGWGNFESVCCEPVVKCVEVWLELLCGRVCVLVLACD